MVHVDVEKIAVVGGAVAAVTVLFLIQKHTTPHPRRAGRSDGLHTLHAAVPGAHGRPQPGPVRAPSQSRSRATSSHRTRREPHSKSASPLPVRGAPHDLTARTSTRPATGESGPSASSEIAPITPLTASALHHHRQREGKAKAVEEHLEGAAALMQLNLEKATTVSNAATTGTNQIGEGDFEGRTRAVASPPPLALGADQAALHGTPEKQTGSAPRSRKHTARPKSAWKHHSTDSASPPAQAEPQDRAVPKEPSRPPPLAVPATPTAGPSTTTAPSGASPPDRSHSSLHLSDLGFSPITPAQLSHIVPSHGTPLYSQPHGAPKAAAVTLPAPLSVLTLLEQELNALVEQVAEARGSPASWMALYVLVHQTPSTALALCYQSSGSQHWGPRLADVRESLVTGDARLLAFASAVTAQLEGCGASADADHHYDWAAVTDSTTVVERKEGRQLSEVQRRWSLRLSSPTATALTVASSSTLSPRRSSARTASPSRFAALLIDSSSSSSSATEAVHGHAAAHHPSASISAALLAALTEKYRSLVTSTTPKADGILVRTPVEAVPVDPASSDALCHALAPLNTLKASASFAQLRRQPEFAVFACDFAQALAQAQHAVDKMRPSTAPSFPATERKSGAAPALSAGAVALHAGGAPSFNVSAEAPDDAGETRGAARLRATSRVSSDGGRSPLQPRRPQTYYRALSTSALAPEPVSPPTSRTVPAKGVAQFERSRTDGHSPITPSSPQAAARPSVFERLYTPPKTSPKGSPSKQAGKPPFRLYDLSHAPTQ